MQYNEKTGLFRAIRQQTVWPAGWTSPAGQEKGTHMKILLYLLGILLAAVVVGLCDLLGASVESYLLLYLIPLGGFAIGYLSVLPIAFGAHKVGFNLHKRPLWQLIPHAVLVELACFIPHYIMRGGLEAGANFFTFSLAALSHPLEYRPLESTLQVGLFDPIYYFIMTVVGLTVGSWLCLHFRSEKADYYCTHCKRYAQKSDRSRLFTFYLATGQGRFLKTEDFLLENVHWVTVPEEIENGYYCGTMQPYRCPGCGEEMVRVQIMLRFKDKFTHQTTFFLPFTETMQRLYKRRDPRLDKLPNPEQHRHKASDAFEETDLNP